VSFERISPVYRKMVLEIIGIRMKTVSLCDCEFIDISEFSSCDALEELSIDGGSLVSEAALGPLNTNNSFLPNLTSFSSDVCLGKLSNLFEEGRNLVSLQLACSHLETKASKFNWNNIPRVWENLEELSLSSAVGLSLENIPFLIAKLKKLKRLELPSTLVKSDAQKKTVKDLELQLMNGNSKCRLEFRDFSVQKICPYQNMKFPRPLPNPKKAHHE